MRGRDVLGAFVIPKLLFDCCCCVALCSKRKKKTKCVMDNEPAYNYLEWEIKRDGNLQKLIMQQHKRDYAEILIEELKKRRKVQPMESVLRNTCWR